MGALVGLLGYVEVHSRKVIPHDRGIADPWLIESESSDVRADGMEVCRLDGAEVRAVAMALEHEKRPKCARVAVYTDSDTMTM